MVETLLLTGGFAPYYFESEDGEEKDHSSQKLVLFPGRATPAVFVKKEGLKMNTIVAEGSGIFFSVSREGEIEERKVSHDLSDGDQIVEVGTGMIYVWIAGEEGMALKLLPGEEEIDDLFDEITVPYGWDSVEGYKLPREFWDRLENIAPLDYPGIDRS